MPDMLGLYIHIPFCARKCRYCDFLSFPGGEGGMDAYTAALISEIALLRAQRPVTSVFIGGGTPSLLPPGAVLRILGAVFRCLPVAPGAEITIESNPGTLSAEKLAEYRAAGVNRLSIGAQSTHDELLARIGRIHTARDVFDAVELAQKAGFSNINVDLMRGLPGQTLEQHLCSLREIAELGVSHMSVYSLIVEEGTPLFADVQAGREKLPTDDEEYEMEKRGIELLERYGFSRYEVSNYARAGRECRHNLNYWLCGEYLAAGLGASGAQRESGTLIRRKNLSDRNAYLAAVGEGRLPVAEEQAVSRDEEMFEVLMLSLRLVAGVELAAFARRFGCDVRELFGGAVGRGCAQGLLTVENGRLRLTERGMDIQNSVLLTFLEG